MLEAARAGAGYARRRGRRARRRSTRTEVLDGVRELLDEVRLEVLLGDGARVVALVDPLGRGDAATRSGRARSLIGDRVRRRRSTRAGERSSCAVTSRSRRRIRVSSHYPFERVNPRLEFDRDAARGSASTSRPVHASAGSRARRRPCASCATPARGARSDDPPLRQEYRAPLRRRRPATGSGSATRTSGSGSAKTGTARGDEPVWGYAKNLRSRIAQWDEASGPSELDVVLAGALVVDPVIGVVKADIGIKDGRIAGRRPGRQPAITDGIDLVIGPHTKSFMAYGLIVTPGAIDTHVHTISPGAPAARAVGRRHHARSPPGSRSRRSRWSGRSPGSRAGR